MFRNLLLSRRVTTISVASAVAQSGIALLITAGTASAGAIPTPWTPPTWDIQRLGFWGPEHTRADGYQNTSIRGVTADGAVFGGSTGYTGSQPTFSSAWVWSKETGQFSLGLSGPLYVDTNSNGSHSLYTTNSQGQYVGLSATYAPGFSLTGTQAWLWDASHGYTLLGFTGPGYFRASTGLGFSVPLHLNDAGVAAGYSNKFSGNNPAGTAAWIWSAGSHVQVGFPHGNREESYPRALNQAGTVIGDSYQFNSSSAVNGSVAWIASADTGATLIGFYDSIHTSSFGLNNNDALFLNNQGQAAGSASRYGPGEFSNGASAWAWTESAGTVRIGFFDSAHIRSNDYQLSEVRDQTESGHIFGFSERYTGAASTGRSAWVWTATAGTERIGLFDAAHTSQSTNYQYSDTTAYNDAGQAVGTSQRYTGFTYTGLTAWLWRGTGDLVTLGVTDALHTRDDGRKESSPTGLNESRQAIGYSRRYSGAATLGLTGWFYDDESGTLTPLTFSQRPDGYSYTYPEIITDNGWVFGTYTLFDHTTDLGNHAFLWSADHGFTDLGAIVDGGLAARGWTKLASVVGTADAAVIAGYGSVVGNTGQAAFALVPHCPADFNHDLTRDVTDLFGFINAWLAKDASADFNADEAVDVADLFGFINAWLAGC